MAAKKPKKLYVGKGTTRRITDAVVSDAAALLAEFGHPDELVIRDTERKGFVLRLRASGRHTFGVALRRGRFTTLGSTTNLTAGKARAKAREDLAQRDLAEDGDSERAKRKRATLTLRSYLVEHYEPWATAHLDTGAETLARLRVQFAACLDTKLVDLSAFTIERWRTARLKAGTAKATVNRDVVALKAALSRAVSWGHLRAHPLTAVKPYKVDALARVRYLDKGEETRLLAALTARDASRRAARDSANKWRRERGYQELPAWLSYTDHLTPVVTLALHTGLRRGEIFALRWADVDLERAILTVRGDGAKSDTTRHVPLNATAVSTLTAWRGPGPRPQPAALVFPAADGGPLEDIKGAWLALVKAAGVEGFRFHDLRHTFASRLVVAGVDLNTVRELLGHRDIKMTLRYAHLAPEVKAAAVAKLVAR